MEVRGAGMEELTSGASGRIIPVFRRSVRSLFGLFLFFYSFLLLLLRRGRRAPTSPLSSPRRTGAGVRKGGWVAEEEDVRRRRALAEAVPMVDESDCRGLSPCRCDTSLFYGLRRNALFYRTWVPGTGELRGILVLIHGLNEHSGRYSRFAMQLTSQNFAVYGLDWTGHGGSDGLHGYVPSLDHVVADTGIFLEKIKTENPGVPCFLFGHSTGGAVVLKASLFRHIEALVEGIILTSPAIRVRPAHPIVGAIAPVFSLVLPKFQFKGANKRGIPVSRDPAAMVTKYSDPLVYTGPIRVRTGHEILRLSSYLTRNLESVKVPFFVLHGSADRVTDPLASQELFVKAASRYKDIRLYEGYLHDLLFEPERDEIGADIVAWMERRLQEGNM